MDYKYVLMAYKIENGFMKNQKILDYGGPNYKERLEYILKHGIHDDLKEEGYKISIFENISD